jgi:hypothetical protein
MVKCLVGIMALVWLTKGRVMKVKLLVTAVCECMVAFYLTGNLITNILGCLANGAHMLQDGVGDAFSG